MKTVIVLQSNYIPWKGYFDLIHDADLFIFYDDLQYTKNDWRNRNKLKSARGAEWLTIPVGIDANRLICEVELKDTTWQSKHWKTIQNHYGKCPHFARYKPFFEDIYLGRQWVNLSELNHHLIRSISEDFLNINTEFQDSRQFDLSGKKFDRLLEIVGKSGAERYVSGPAAKDYIDASRFADANIELVWKDYSGYPEYPQRFPPFEHGVSIIDLLFNTGSDAPWYIWGWRNGPLSS
ncbi:MAG: WbqC family protein [Propionivibrio sp.]|uniref:WbqC family protein n=1 Tax=Propionivibrio sp. TaxID=2212460 RepID=UPI0025F4AA29|nr:WbqC family protein [Propionivibrio sp.]MBK8893853.1 WbqC family protein [Propionivibrio sp.]